MEKSFEKAMEKRIKAVEDALGLGSGPAKNINLLLDTVRGQGEQIGRQQDQITAANTAASLRDSFIKKVGMETDFQKFLKMLTAPKPAEPVEFETKRAEPPAEIIHAPNKGDLNTPLCKEPMMNDSRMIQHDEAVTCMKCIAELNKTKKQVVDMPPPEKEGVATIRKGLNPIPEPKQKDAGGKISRK